MLQDFDGKTMSISKRLTARQLIADLDRLHKEGSHDDIHELCESYIKRETLPKHNIYMAKVQNIKKIFTAIPTKSHYLVTTYD